MRRENTYPHSHTVGAFPILSVLLADCWCFSRTVGAFSILLALIASHCHRQPSTLLLVGGCSRPRGPAHVTWCLSAGDTRGPRNPRTLGSGIIFSIFRTFDRPPTGAPTGLYSGTVFTPEFPNPRAQNAQSAQSQFYKVKKGVNWVQLSKLSFGLYAVKTDPMILSIFRTFGHKKHKTPRKIPKPRGQNAQPAQFGSGIIFLIFRTFGRQLVR